MKKNIIFIIIILISTVFVGCENSTNNTDEKLEIDKYIGEINYLKAELSEKENEISQLKINIENLKGINNNNLELKNNYLVEERDYYRKFIDSYLSNLSEDELIQIALKEWSYLLYIENIENAGNKVVIPENGIVNLDVSNFRIVLVERQPMFPIIKNYMDIFMKGSIDNYRSHIKLLNDDKLTWDESGSDGTVVTSKVYEITDLEKGTTVEFEITDILKSRLKLNTNTIKVNIK